jgi:hypothetical protein
MTGATERCDACTSGPRGIEGHPDLMVQKMSGSHLAFRCRKCGALWTRGIRIGDAGPFAWSGPLTMDSRGMGCFAAGVVLPLGNDEWSGR